MDPRVFEAIQHCYRWKTTAERDEGIRAMRRLATEDRVPMALRFVAHWHLEGFAGGSVQVLVGSAMCREAAELGDPMAQALCYLNGWGKPVNQSESWRLLEPLPFDDDPVVLYYRAVYTERGIGCAADPELALLLYQQGRDYGEPTCICNMGLVYQRGLVGPKDFPAALECYERAAELGVVQAIYNVGYFHAMHFHLPVDHNIARQKYLQAARLGLDQAIKRLYRMYLSPRQEGAPCDVDYALYWERFGAERGFDRVDRWEGDCNSPIN